MTNLKNPEKVVKLSQMPQSSVFTVWTGKIFRFFRRRGLVENSLATILMWGVKYTNIMNNNM